MKTILSDRGSRRPVFRLPCLVAILLGAGVSARASLAELLQTDLSQNLVAEQSLVQLSTGLQINSAGGNLDAANPYAWLQAAPNVLSLSYNPLQVANQQQQTLLQLLQGGNNTQLGVAQLAQASQSQQSVLQLFTGNNSQAAQVSEVAQLVQAQTVLQQADAQPQQVLKLLGASDNAASLQVLQQASVQSLSLANDQLQTSVSSLQQASQVQSALNLVQANQLNQLSTGLKINQAADPAQLTLSTINGTVVQLSQNNDGYNNTLGLNTSGLSINNASLQALFTDAANLQTLQTPLVSSDFTTVGQLNQKQALQFFQMAQAVSGNTLQLLSSGDSINSISAAPGVGDTFSTSVLVMNNLNSPYLFISIADQSGLDAQDYNSAVLAFNIGSANVHALLAAPEPSMYLTLGGFLALAIWAKRRRDTAAVAI